MRHIVYTQKQQLHKHLPLQQKTMTETIQKKKKCYQGLIPPKIEKKIELKSCSLVLHRALSSPYCPASKENRKCKTTISIPPFLPFVFLVSESLEWGRFLGARPRSHGGGMKFSWVSEDQKALNVKGLFLKTVWSHLLFFVIFFQNERASYGERERVKSKNKSTKPVMERHVWTDYWGVFSHSFPSKMLWDVKRKPMRRTFGLLS